MTSTHARGAGSVYALLVAILVLAAFLRFFMLSEIGIRGSDTIYYLTVARGWIDAPEDRRRIILGIYALVARLGGDSDWSIKALNAGLDVFSVLLAFLIALRASGRRRVALLTALSYALLPRAIAYSRTELLHTAATSVFLTSFACLIWYLTSAPGTRRLVALGLSGLFIGLGYGVHDDLMPFVPGMVACVLLAAFGGAAPPGRALQLRARRALAHAGIFLAAALAVMTPLGFWSRLLWIGSRLEKASEAAPRAAAVQGFTSISYPELFQHVVEFNSSALVAFLFYALPIAAVALGLLANRRPPTRLEGRTRGSARSIGLVDFAPAILIFSQLLLYPFVASHVDARHFLSAMPLVLLSVFVWMDWTVRLLLRERRGGAVLYAVAALAVIVVDFSKAPTPNELKAKIEPEHRPRYLFSYAVTVPGDPKDSLDSSKYPISFYRSVYELLKGRVDEQNRLLVTPYIALSDHGARRGFRHYFGDDAVYIEDCEGSLEQFIEDRRVRFVVRVTFNEVRPAKTPVCYGLRKDEYTMEKEFALLDSFLSERRQARLLAKNRRFLLYEIPAERR